MAHMFVISRLEELSSICKQEKKNWGKKSREPIFPYLYSEIQECLELLEVYINYIVETKELWIGKRLKSMTRQMNHTCRALYGLIYKRRKHPIYLKPLLSLVNLRKKIMYLR